MDPFTIIPDVEMICNTIPHAHENPFELQRFWKNGEQLHIGKIKKEDLHLENCVFDFNFFENGIHWDFDTIKKAQDTGFPSKAYRDYVYYVETFTKLVWLLDEFLADGRQFRNPIGAHYNPRLGANIVHPGGSRKNIIRLFADKPLDCIYFNTGGVSFPWMNEMRRVDLESLYEEFTDIFTVYVADHGSLIPHVHIGSDTIFNGVMEYQMRIRKRFLEDGFYITGPDWLGAPTKGKHRIRVDVASERATEDDFQKIAMLICLNYNVKASNFSITMPFKAKTLEL